MVRDDCPDRSSKSLLRFAFGSDPLAAVILAGLSGGCRRSGERPETLRFPGECDFAKTICAVPEGWEIRPRQGQMLRGSRSKARSDIIHYGEDVRIGPELVDRAGTRRAGESWLVISNGRFVTQINIGLLERVLAGVRPDVLAVNTTLDLLGDRERIRLTADGNVAGFRRMYSDTAELAFIPDQWPHHLLIRASALEQVLVDGVLPCLFSDLSQRCQSQELAVRAVNVGGVVFDLETESGLLNFCMMKLSSSQESKSGPGGSSMISPDARLVGRV
ncbi:MAG: hypothetical protein ACYTDV_13720, partial [Planctomycetota bacterium]